jgi:nitroimidazol reductase NimA-like FMN-containing flavoprotein (pyridoxamine 5'-phosphate oxidase superfamily)
MTDAWFDELSHEECLCFLRDTAVGRMAVVVDDFPVVVPVNYRLVEASGRTWLAVRTRAGNFLDRPRAHAAFEIDGIDSVRRSGWSVLVRGIVEHVDPDAAEFRSRFDPEPWIASDRNAWLIIEPFAITGRRLRPEEPDWAWSLGSGPARS